MSKEDNMRNLAGAIVHRRFILGITQGELAKMACVGVSSLRGIENWYRTPDRMFRPATLFAIENALGWERHTISRIVEGYQNFPSIDGKSYAQVSSAQSDDTGIVAMGMIQDMIYSYVRQQAMLTTVGIRN